MKYYKQDLAYIHDVGHGEFARKSAPGILSILQSNGIQDGLVVDLGCGSGLLARVFVRYGYDVLGIDLSASMIRLARKNAPRATFCVDSVLKAKLPDSVAVLSIGECLNYTFESNTKGHLRQLFLRVFASLRAGGVFVFDILEPGQILPNTPRKRHSQGKDWAVLVEVEEDQRRNLLTRKITTFRKVGKQYRRNEETHCQRLFFASELAQELRRVGFRVKLLEGYGKLKFSRAHTAILARKPVKRVR
jgi:SAM-dependent methyltransferase